MTTTVRAALLTAATLAAGCASTNFSSTWKAPDAKPGTFKGKKVVAVFVSQDEALRRGVEETLYIVSGRGRQMVEDADGTPVYREVVAGDMVHIPISVYHETINTGWEPLKIVATYAPHGPEAFLRSLPEVKILAPGEVPQEAPPATARPPAR